MNAIPANAIKRHGISAVEKLLAQGPVHVIKRNQPVCVVLGEDEYRQLTKAAQAGAASPAPTVMEWLALYPAGTATKAEIDGRPAEARAAWDKP